MSVTEANSATLIVFNHISIFEIVFLIILLHFTVMILFPSVCIFMKLKKHAP